MSKERENCICKDTGAFLSRTCCMGVWRLGGATKEEAAAKWEVLYEENRERTQQVRESI